MIQWVIRTKTLHHALWKRLAGMFNKENPNVNICAEMAARKFCHTLLSTGFM